MNTTITTSITSVNSLAEWFPVLILFTLIGGFTLAIISYAWFTRVYGTLGKIKRMIILAIEGVGITGTVYAIYFLSGQLCQAASGIDPIWVLYGIAFFIMFVVVGFISEIVLSKLKQNWRKMKNKKRG